MSNSRLQILLDTLEKEPEDSFTKYAVGIEYMAMDDIENARDTLEALRSSDPGYLAVYYQLGRIYEMLGDEISARKIFELGMIVAEHQGEHHTRSELEQALDDLKI